MMEQCPDLKTLGQKLTQNLARLIGDDPGREGLGDTPRRLAQSWEHLFGGYKLDPEKVLSSTFNGEGYDELIVLRDIEFYSTCEHHFLPFFGVAHVGYIPNQRVVGLSKLARLVDLHARRLQNQERLTFSVATDLSRILGCKGVGVVVEASHLCMRARGVEKQNSMMTTSTLLGVLREAEGRSEFLKLIGK